MASTGKSSINDDETMSVAESEESLDDLQVKSDKDHEDVKGSKSPRVMNPRVTISDSPEIVERVTDIADSVSSSKSSVSDGLPKTSSMPRIAYSFSRDSDVYPPIHARSKSYQVDPENPLSVMCQTIWDWKTDLVLMQESLGISRGVQTVEAENIEGDDLELELPYLREIYDHLDSQYELHTADDKYYDEPVTPGPYLDCGMGPPVILQNTLETRLRVPKTYNLRGHPALGAQYTAHYEILDSCLLDYIVCTDLKARDRVLRSAKVCPFCNGEINPDSHCCERFRDYSEDIRRWGEDVENYQQSELGDHDRSNSFGFGHVSGGFGGDGKGHGRERYHSEASKFGMDRGQFRLGKDGTGGDRDQDARTNFGKGGGKSLSGGRNVRMVGSGVKARHNPNRGKLDKGGAGDGKHGKQRSPDRSSVKIKERIAAAKERAAAAAAAAAARAERLRAAAANRARAGAAHSTVSQGSDGTQQHFGAGTRDKVTTITYQLSSQKYVEEGWTILPKVPPPREDDDDGRGFNCVSGLLEPDQPQYQDAEQREPVTRYYDSGALFVVIFADGSGSVFYPSGRLAISIVTMGPGLFTYIVQDDTVEANIVAVFQPTGYSIVYYNNGKPRISLNPFGGVELTSSGSRRRGWNWNELDSLSSGRDPFPTIYPIALGVNCNCGLRIMSQHDISLTFAAECRSCRFHVGARLKNSCSKKLQPLTNSSNKNLSYLKDAQSQIDSIFRKMLTVLQFPKSPKLEKILLPLESSRREKTKKLSDVEEEKLDKLDSLNSAAASTIARCSCSFKVSVTSS